MLLKGTLNSNKKSILSRSLKCISSKDIGVSDQEVKVKVKYNPSENPKNWEKFEKEFNATHWLSKYTEGAFMWISAPFKLGLFNWDRDTEQGRYRWNCHGNYQNSISKILYRTEGLQSRWLMKFFMKRFDHRYTTEYNKAEEQPKISPNSVYLFKDNSNFIQNRRIAERLALFLIISQAWNVPTFLAYFGTAYVLHVYQKTYSCSRAMVKRMDLIPETEQLHCLKIGMFGMPRSVLVNVKDLIKIDKEEDLNCNFAF
jgi:hypothetical protein